MVFAGFKPAQDAAAYMAEAGLPYTPPTTYAKVDSARAKRIADAFEAAPNTPEAVRALFTAAFKSQQENVDDIQATWEPPKRKGLP